MDVIPEIERQNSAKSGLARLVGESRSRVAPPPTGAQYTTLPDGRVLDRGGKTVYTPTPRDEKKP